jgi:transposase-like protein
MTPETQALGHTPEARRKAEETKRRNRLKKLAEEKEAKANGIKIPKNAKKTTFDVSSLPPRPAKNKTSKRKNYSVEEKARIVARINTIRNQGMPTMYAASKIGIAPSMYTNWIKNKDVKRALKAAPAMNGHDLVRTAFDKKTSTMKVVIEVNDRGYEISIDEAIKIKAALAALGF